MTSPTVSSSTQSAAAARTVQADQRRLKADQAAKAGKQVIAADQARIRKDQSAAAKTAEHQNSAASGTSAPSALAGQGNNGKDGQVDTYA
jgi:hypothetical protein